MIDSVNARHVVFLPALKPLACGGQSRCLGWIFYCLAARNLATNKFSPIFFLNLIALQICNYEVSNELSAPSIAVFLRLRFSDAGEKSQRFFGPKVSSLSAREPCDFFLRQKLLAIAVLFASFRGKNVLTAVLLAIRTFATKNCGDL